MALPRYLIQQDDHSCSPVAVTNAILWAHNCNKYNTLCKVVYTDTYKQCKTAKDGTYDSDMEKTLRWSGKVGKYNGQWHRTDSFKVRKPRKFDVELVTKHLTDPDKAIIMSHIEPWDDAREWHHSFWAGSRLGFYWGYNVKPGWGFWITRKSGFEKLLNSNDGNEQAEVWLLEKQ